jgi:hypothetical protein
VVSPGEHAGRQVSNQPLLDSNNVGGQFIAPVGASSIGVGKVLEIEFPSFRPRITFISLRQLTVEIVSGDNAGFTDTVEYEAVAIRDGLIAPLWKEHIGSTVVHVLDLTAERAHTFVTPATGDFMRLIGHIQYA